MNNLLDIDPSSLPPDPDAQDKEKEEQQDASAVSGNGGGEPDVKYWAFGAKWYDLEPEDIEAMADNEHELDEWLKDQLKPDVELAESMLACMVVKNDPENGDYTIALWSEGSIVVEPNDNEEKRSDEHAGEIVSSEEVSEFLQRSLEIIRHALSTVTIVIDKYSEQAKSVGIDLKLLGDLTADPSATMEKIEKAVANPKESLKQ